MRILSKSEIEILTELWLEDLPRRILETICQSPGITQAAVLRLFTRSLPTSIESYYILDRCVSSLNWFLHHGDIASCGTRRYVAIPPYAVLTRSLSSKFLLTLLGDPRLDQEVSDSIAELGCRLEIRLVAWRWDNWGENPAPKLVGLIRHLISSPEQLSEVELRFRTLNIPIIQSDVLQARLPSINHLNTPSEAAFMSAPPNWGHWDSYDAQSNNPVRWQPQSDWNSSAAGIVRWRPSEDHHGEANARFFLIRDQTRFFELSSTSAKLWMLFFDLRANNPRRFWINEKTLWTPLSILPEAHEQWLQLVAQDHHRDSEYMKYYLEGDIGEVGNILKNTLGLQPSVSTPFTGTRR